MSTTKNIAILGTQKEFNEFCNLSRTNYLREYRVDNVKYIKCSNQEHLIGLELIDVVNISGSKELVDLAESKIRVNII